MIAQIHTRQVAVRNPQAAQVVSWSDAGQQEELWEAIARH
jgi:hypothetical protein